MDTQPVHEAISLDDVRLAIRRQHTQLAQLLDELEGYAARVIKGDDCAGYLSATLILLRRRFLRHLEFEEARLAPLLSAARVDRAAALHESLGHHADQRARIEGLLHDERVFTDPKTPAREALAFVHMMRVEMADEDSALGSLG
jgi:hypothetical protein